MKPNELVLLIVYYYLLIRFIWATIVAARAGYTARSWDLYARLPDEAQRDFEAEDLSE